MKILYRIAADILVIFHTILFLFILLGWLIPNVWWLYMIALVITLVSDIVFGYCILSRWEFWLRKKVNPNIDYDFGFATYYTYKLTNHRMSNVFFDRAAIVFLIIMILLQVYFKFLF